MAESFVSCKKTIFIDTSRPAQIYLTVMELMKFLVEHLKNWDIENK